MLCCQIGGEEWIQTDMEHISLMKMLVEKYDEQEGKSIGGYSMDELNRMVEQQELQKQYEEDMKAKRRKRRKRIYGDDYIDPLDIEEEKKAKEEEERKEEEAKEAKEQEEMTNEMAKDDNGEFNHEEL